MGMEDILKKHSYEYAFISPEVIEFSTDITDLCKANSCGNYNTSWMCPPAVATPDVIRKTCLESKNAVVFTTLHKIEDSFDFEGMSSALITHNQIQSKILKEIEIYNFVMGAGKCIVCEKCTYPDKPCRAPNEAQTSLESCGVNVVNLAKTAGVNYYNGENTVTYFSVIFF